MGCGLTKAIPLDFLDETRKRRDTAPMCVDDLKKSLLDEYTHIQKRFGHPQYYKKDGYTLGIRINGFERFHSFYVGQARVSTDKVTIKEHHMSHCSESEIIQEVLILAKLQHPSLPLLKDLFITTAAVYTVSEQLDACRLSQLYDFRPNSKNTLSLNDTRVIIKQVMEAVHYCHNRQIIVRNLTPRNVCVKRRTDAEGQPTGNFEVKIADFSLAVNSPCHDYLCDSHFFKWDHVPFMAPEALLGNEYSYPMDMWAIGVLLFMMVTNKLPFQHDDDVELMHQITHSIYSFPIDRPGSLPVPAPLRHLIMTLLFVDTGMRLNAVEGLNNTWLTSPALPEECLTWDV